MVGSSPAVWEHPTSGSRDALLSWGLQHLSSLFFLPSSVLKILPNPSVRTKAGD